MVSPVDIGILKSEVTEIQRRHNTLSTDNAFVFWFLHAFLIEDEKAVGDAIVGGPRDKGIDAIYVDHPNKKVFIIQGKYRTKEQPPSESHSDVIAFTNLARTLCGSPAELKNVLANADAIVRDRVTTAYGYLRRRKYLLHLYFVTTGKVSSSLEDEAQAILGSANGQAELDILTRRELLNLLRDYLDGAAPPVPSLDMPVEPGEAVRGGGMVRRYDPSTGIESWVFSMVGSDVGDLYAHTGVRLFARNIRGFLGKTEINRGMENTLKRHPKNFWYFNNGITIVCDKARKIEEHGREILRVFNPQIINGQQTTRVLKDHGSKRASVIVRVISIPRKQDSGSDGFEGLVSSIVAATNWQNAIRPSDLRSNDGEQVRIEREFRRLNYQYLRKRLSKSEARRLFGAPKRHRVKKEDLAKAIAACEFDPVVVRLGKEGLFEGEYYRRIFCGRPAAEYLMFVWLDRVVRYGAKGRPERAYARWLVLNFVWSNVKYLISRDPGRRKLLYTCEHRAIEWRLRYLNRYVNTVFNATGSFFRAKRGRGSKALDVSSFFRRVNLDDRFRTYWYSAANPYRGSAREALKRFKWDLLKAGDNGD